MLYNLVAACIRATTLVITFYNELCFKAVMCIVTRLHSSNSVQCRNNFHLSIGHKDINDPNNHACIENSLKLQQ